MDVQAISRTLFAHDLSTTGSSRLAPLRSATGATLVAATVLACAVAALDANVMRAPVGASLLQ